MPPLVAPDKSSIATPDTADGSTCTDHWRRSTIRSDRTAAAASSSSSGHSTTAASFDRNTAAGHNSSHRNIADYFDRSIVSFVAVVMRLCLMHRLS